MVQKDHKIGGIFSAMHHATAKEAIAGFREFAKQTSPHNENTNLECIMRRMDEASKGGATMTPPTKSPAFDALAEIIGNGSIASNVLDAIEAGKVPDIVTFADFAAPYKYSLQVLDELQIRMTASKADATVTQLKLEIETGKYEVGQ